MRQAKYAYASSTHPESWGCCDRCGFMRMRNDLQWQFQWAGPSLINTRLLVCRECLDIPNEQLRTIFVGPDPVPIKDPRPAPDSAENSAGALRSAIQPVGFFVVPD